MPSATQGGPEDIEEEMFLFPLMADSDSDSSMKSVSSPHGSISSSLNGNTEKSSGDEAGDEAEDEEVDDNRNMPFKPLMSLRQRRRSLLNGQSINGMNINNINANGFNINLQIAHARVQRRAQRTSIVEDDEFTVRRTTEGFEPRRYWKKAFRLIRQLKDPWVDHHIETCPAETVIRHRYNPLKKKWAQDEVQVKMEKQPFNHGAMRACYRLKKLSKFTNNRVWKHAQNYVAKMYMEEVERDVYFEDVKLQMEAKLWGEEFNRHNPPKKVDIFQMYVVEFKDRPGSPLYHLEHYIEGRYIKYNSNSGFVEENLRLTPQAFSHFTFERSGHQLIVVDIQGVGDLWTDPQIHTFDGLGYGDGNLGTRGMALFFHSHVCNRICQCLKLTPFDLAPTEVQSHTKYIAMQKNSSTEIRGTEAMCISPTPADRADLTAFLARNRSRTISTMSELSERQEDEHDEDNSSSESEPSTADSLHNGMEEPMSLDSHLSPIQLLQRRCRIRLISESEMSDDSAAGTLTEEEERFKFQQAVVRGARPSCVEHEMNMRTLHGNNRVSDSILGEVHHNLSKYHELRRFVVEEKDEFDIEAALFHEEVAARLGVKEAILTMAQLCLNLPHDVLVNVTVQQNGENLNKGVDYMLTAAEIGDRGAMLYIAKAYETGLGLGSDRTRSFDLAVDWYQRVVQVEREDDSGEFDPTMDNPRYLIKAKLAELYLEGGYGLEKDPSYSGEMYTEAAEEAMTAMKGRLANKYYALAEEAWAQVEE